MRKATTEDFEMRALKWLLNLRRLDYKKVGFKRCDNQIIVRILPGKLEANQGAPGFKVSIALPYMDKRVVESGTSLFMAVDRLHRALWHKGIRLPGVNWSGQVEE